MFFIITYAGDLYGAANAFCCGTRLTGSIDRCLLIGELLYRGFLWAPKNSKIEDLLNMIASTTTRSTYFAILLKLKLESLSLK